jgi:hypothetical protein
VEDLGIRARRSFAPTFVLFSLLALLAAIPSRAQNHPASLTDTCGTQESGGRTSCPFKNTGSYVNPGAGQLMVFLAAGPGGQTLSSITDTYFGTQTCTGTTCGTWTAFSASPGTWSNSSLGITSSQVIGYWAKTGAHSGAETITPNWSGSGTLLFGLAWSLASTDAAVSATNPEDTSVFQIDTNTNGCTAPSPVSGTYTLGFSGGVVLSMVYYNPSRNDTTNSVSGPTQRSIDSNDTGYANMSGWTGATGTIIPISAGAHMTTWSWGTCFVGHGPAAIMTIALKPGSAAAPAGRVKHRVIQ